MSLPTSTVGRKILMTITGQMMVLFVIIHMLGNSTIYFHKLNAYAAGLHALPCLYGCSVSFMVCMPSAPYLSTASCSRLRTGTAKPQAYAVTLHLSATFAGRNMIWTGVNDCQRFLVYHLLQFTVQVIDPHPSRDQAP